MIYLYTEKQESDNWILKNDLYFNLYTSNLPFTEQDKRAVFQIDGARITEDKHIETKYGLGTVRNLSSGCKTYLNVIKNPDRVVSAKECGGNVLTLLFRLDGIHIYMDCPERFEIGKDTQIMINDKEIVVGKAGYEAWWSKEYKRRAEDDL
ncbi:DUF4869 domain-containing protein [Ruminococcus sp. 5_1_39BFAA]|uniref:DUF4869 domain-containing protein n=1 Tax=Ruminococcus sp. 5_1_39BFAA TaxID=457412 RepID=UPI003568ED08